MFDNFFTRILTEFVEGNGFNLLLKGLRSTLIIAVFGFIIGVVLGTVLAILKIIPGENVLIKAARFAANFYITVIRGIPLVVLLLLGFFGIFGPMGWSALPVGVLIFGINSSAYVAEIIRSGILAVDRGQMEAGRSLGLPYGVTMWKIILPQAVKNILPALGNELITIIKETAVAGFITVYDMTRATSELVSTYYDVFVPYVMLALAYLVIVLFATFLLNRFERRLRRSDIR